MCFLKHQSFLFKRLKIFRNEKVFIGIDSLLTMITNFENFFPIFIPFLKIWKMCQYKMNVHIHNGMQCEMNLTKIISFSLWNHGLQYNVWMMHVKWCAPTLLSMHASWSKSLEKNSIQSWHSFFHFPQVILSQFLLAQHETSFYFGFFFLLIFSDFSFNHQQHRF